ncbi:hypothetical protein KSF73_11980 [Burkholderiaceae bacterium DAT-1]|nr:hypothetical protein [Burkholderiaceae bacterium DAT-1]
MIKSKIAVLGLIVSLLAGCATVTPIVPMTPGSLKSDGGVVGIAMSTVPVTDTFFPGAGCLLCYAAASAMNATLTTHARTLAADDLNHLKEDIAGTLNKNGVKTVIISEAIKVDKLEKTQGGVGKSPYDLSAFKSKYGIDRIIFVDVKNVGFLRNYSAYVPTSDPKGYFEATGMMVDLNTNSLQWYQPVNVQKAAEDKWDEAPKYPGLTNAFYQALVNGSDMLIGSIRSASTVSAKNKADQTAEVKPSAVGVSN